MRPRDPVGVAGTGERRRTAPVLVAAPTVVAVVIVVIVAVVAGALWWSGRDDRPDVLVVGDSVSYLSASPIEARLGAAHVQFATKPGFTTEQILPVARDAAALPGEPGASREVALVLIGYNDIFLEVTDDSPLDELVGFAEEFRCTVWLTLPERPGGEPSPSSGVPTPAIERWNDQLAGAVADHPTIHLATDWQDAIEAAPAPGADGTGSAPALEDDAVHPTAVGSELLAAAADAAIARHC